MRWTQIDIRDSDGTSLLASTLTTRVMTTVCIGGFVLSLFVRLEDYMSSAIFFVLPFSVVFWLGLYTDLINLICASVKRNTQDIRFYKYSALFDAVLLLLSVSVVLRLPTDGMRHYLYLMYPIGLIVVVLSFRKLYFALR